MAAGLTDEVAGHLLVLLEAAGVAELQQGVHVVGAGLQQDLRGAGSWQGSGHAPAAPGPGPVFSSGVYALRKVRPGVVRPGP